MKISDFGMSRSLYDSQLTTTAFVGILLFQFVGCQLNAFMVNSHRGLQVIEDALKRENRKTLAKPDMCPLEVYEIMLKMLGTQLQTASHI